MKSVGSSPIISFPECVSAVFFIHASRDKREEVKKE